MSWWRRVQQAFVKPSSTSSLKKNVSENLSFLQKKYRDLAKDKGEDLRKTLKTSVSDYGKRAKNVPQDLKARSAELGRQARVRAEKATSGLGKQLGDSARALPSKTAEVCLLVALYLSRSAEATACCTVVGASIRVHASFRLPYTRPKMVYLVNGATAVRRLVKHNRCHTIDAFSMFKLIVVGDRRRSSS